MDLTALAIVAVFVGALYFFVIRKKKGKGGSGGSGGSDDVNDRTKSLHNTIEP